MKAEVGLKSQETYQRLRQCCFTHTGHSSTNFGFGQKKKLNDTKGIIKSRKYNAMAEWKRTNNALRNTTQKTTDKAIQTLLKTEDVLGYLLLKVVVCYKTTKLVSF